MLKKITLPDSYIRWGSSLGYNNDEVVQNQEENKNENEADEDLEDELEDEEEMEEIIEVQWVIIFYVYSKLFP